MIKFENCSYIIFLYVKLFEFRICSHLKFLFTFLIVQSFDYFQLRIFLNLNFFGTLSDFEFCSNFDFFKI
jgi:hypothetical protein